MTEQAQAVQTTAEKITCQICGESVHSIQKHIADKHDDWTLDKYKDEFPDAPLMSELLKSRLAEKKSGSAPKIHMATAAIVNMPGGQEKKAMHEVFGLGNVAAAKNARGEAIPVTVFGEGDFDDMVPEVDKAYIFDIGLLKTILMGLEEGDPIYLWGHAGVGKSTILEQVAAHTARPYCRVQHTASTEEAHIVGQLLANEQGTYFEPGPLALAMKHGWVYNADEYDYAHPSVCATYQAVLEGKPLVIKEAPKEWRVIKPHPNFRFVATGNTNGSGDANGLYTGTTIGNAANYSRFAITEHVDYMPANQEANVIAGQAGVVKDDAKKLVAFATEVRKAFGKGEMTATIGPRELIYAAKYGLRKADWRAGLKLAYINRLNPIDREVADGIAQRLFG